METKTITIETSRTSIEKIMIDTEKGARMLKRELPELGIIPFRSIISILTFSEPILDVKDRPYDKLLVHTPMFHPSSGPYWQSSLKRANQIIITQGSRFGVLHDPISYYNARILKEWFNEAEEAHSSYLKQIEEQYWQNQRLNCG